MLKSLLSLLLSKFYSKQESEAVGHQAMPSVSAISLSPITSSVTDWAPVYEGIAPTDGYAAITFTADTDNCIAAAQTTNINTFSTPQVKGDVLMAACPVAKGQPFGLYAREAHDIACWFTKTIGGGYQALKKLILQGITGNTGRWQTLNAQVEKGETLLFEGFVKVAGTVSIKFIPYKNT